MQILRMEVVAENQTESDQPQSYREQKKEDVKWKRKN